MPQTLLAKKSGPQDNAIATDDQHHEQLAADPTIEQFPQNSDFNTTITTGASTMPATTGFGSSNFGSPSTSTSGFGASNSFSSTPSVGMGSTSGIPGPQTNLTQAGSNAAQGADVLVEHDKESSDWINKKWRPVMGWMYMVVCMCDFVLFPVLWSILQALTHGNVSNQWQPLTLQGAGLFHIAMGAVLGIAAYGRTKEKVAGAA